ncbi:MAG: hypothetical protein AABY84_02635 [Candidatus Firestonebacteria bacterium]
MKKYKALLCLNDKDKICSDFKDAIYKSFKDIKYQGSGLREISFLIDEAIENTTNEYLSAECISEKHKKIIPELVKDMSESLLGFLLMKDKGATLTSEKIFKIKEIINKNLINCLKKNINSDKIKICKIEKC